MAAPTRNLIWLFVGTLTAFLLASTSAGFLLLRRRVLQPIEALTAKIIAENPESESLEVASEIRMLEGAIEQHLNQLKRKQAELIRVAEVEALAQISSQVAHDIRSPLAALEMVVKELDSIPEEQRLLVRSSTNRIRDISNDLLESHRLHKTDSGGHELRSELLSGLVELIISEKRMQYRARTGLDIEAELGSGAYGLFANVSPREFKRVISNLVNNAAEAMENGQISVSVYRKGPDAVVEVRDNGKGMPKAILERLGKGAVSSGKSGTDSGSGLGVMHAFRSAESWGGTIEISSEENHGTSFRIRLPLVSPPNWFPESISIGALEVPVVVDDDPSVLQAWRGRFVSSGIKSYLHFSTPEDFSRWLTDEKRIERHLFLIDFEFIGAPDSGLDLIDRFKIGDRSVLVTSRFEESEVRHRVGKLGTKLLPKGLVAYIPISLESTQIATSTANVLLEGDSLMHHLWLRAAKKAGVRLQCFSNSGDLFREVSKFDKATVFYIDSNLDTEKGEDIAKRLFEMGFENLHLATGYSASHFGPMPWIKSILGKEPPWI